MSGVVAPEYDSKPVAEKSNSSICITVQNINVDENKTAVCFSIKRDSPLSRLMCAYYDFKKIEIHRAEPIAFLYDGARIRPWHTSDELGIQDGDNVLSELLRMELMPF
ncbi:hypothetical protein MKW94_000138 [Papaver nudicaule]|uniref:Rad60/SUMO-like domain-containing protein n=1 Tax=Papaver nudicaule TaxID=74823 RepID=A0AA41S408_PAPNU|nr:hypothetical protein [Papaver nudicaule]